SEDPQRAQLGDGLGERARADRVEQLAPNLRAPLRVRDASDSSERLGVEGDLARRQDRFLVAEDARREQVQEAVLAAGRQRVVQAGRRLEELAAGAALAYELRDLLHGRDAR